MPAAGTTELTPRQRQVFEWVKTFIREHAMPPTVREIGDAFGIKSSSVSGAAVSSRGEGRWLEPSEIRESLRLPSVQKLGGDYACFRKRQD